MNEWQPIRTAPMDGTAVLLWPGVMTWTEEMGPSVGWFARGLVGWVCGSAWLKPTHWMPLPPAPEATP